MKKSKKVFFLAFILLVATVLLVLLMNFVLMPLYVSGTEVEVPKVIGLNLTEAERVITDAGLVPMPGEERLDDRFPKGSVIFQKPRAGSVVKEGRRVYLSVSGGEPQVIMPDLRGKSLREARFTLEKLGLHIGLVEETPSEEFEIAKIIHQSFPEGQKLTRGTSVNIILSMGPEAGMIRVPSLLGKSLGEAERILRENSLNTGKINYRPSVSLLPNTIIDQYPSEDKLIALGGKVDLFVTSTISSSDNPDFE